MELPPKSPFYSFVVRILVSALQRVKRTYQLLLTYAPAYIKLGIGSPYNTVYLRCVYDSGVIVNIEKCSYHQQIHKLSNNLVADSIDFKVDNYDRLSIIGLD